MSPKLGAAIPVLNEWRFMPAVIGQMLKFVDRCVIMRPSRSQSGAIVSLSKIPDLDPRVDVLEGNWRSEAETRNAGMDYLEDCDYVFMIDSDEILLDEDLETLQALCEQAAHPVISVKLHTYWKTPDYVIDPPEDGTIKMVLRKDVRLYGVREVRGPVHPSDVYCHHLSYVRSDDEVREKIRLSGHASEIRPDWYERVWKAWDKNPDLENLHPVHPPAYRRAVPRADLRMKGVLEEWGCS
jgi:glycosyltransferase involved in cell wall biosynthesis